MHTSTLLRSAWVALPIPKLQCCQDSVPVQWPSNFATGQNLVTKVATKSAHKTSFGRQNTDHGCTHLHDYSMHAGTLYSTL